jgi:cell division protein ZapA
MMADDQLIPLNIVIADRSYRIKILASDEETIRRVLKTINEKILEFKTQFAGKDMQDYVSMVLIWYATQAKENTTEILSEDLVTSLLKMEKQLDEVI